MKVAVLTFSSDGDKIFHKFFRNLSFDLYSKEENNQVKKSEFELLWKDYDCFIFISATGIAVRYIAPLIQKKDIDPAVLVIDDQKKFVISLLSGHLGGANFFAKKISEIISAQAVITTASDGRNFQSIDLFAKKYGYHIEDLASLTPVASAMIEKKQIAFYTEDQATLKYPNLRIVKNIESTFSYDYSILITSKKKIKRIGHQAILRPKIIHLGIGAKKGAKKEDLFYLVKKCLNEKDISIHSVKDISSIDLKKDESAILSLREALKVPFYTFTAEELVPFEKFCQCSDFVKKTVGVGSVSCTCAKKMSDYIVLEKASYNGFTLSISKEI